MSSNMLTTGLILEYVMVVSLFGLRRSYGCSKKYIQPLPGRRVLPAPGLQSAS